MPTRYRSRRSGMRLRLSVTARQIPSFGWIFPNAPTTPRDRNATHAVWTEVLSAEARLAPAVTGALCSALDSLRDDVDPARLQPAARRAFFRNPGRCVRRNGGYGSPD